MNLTCSIPDTLPRTVLVTGGAKRIGRELCLALARSGFNVAVHYNSSEHEAFELVEELRAINISACAVHADLNDEAQVLGLMSQATKQLGCIGVLVNNASLFSYDEFKQLPPLSLAHFERIQRINIYAPILLMQQFSQQLSELQTGVVVNLLDQKLRNPNPDFLSYTLSKSALEQAGILAAQAFAPKIRVVGIAPGISLPSGGQTVSDFQIAHAQTILHRSSDPQDIAQAMLYVIAAKSVTGVTLLVDGGQHLTAQSRDVMLTHKLPS